MAWPPCTRSHHYRRLLYNFTLPNAQSFISLATYIIVRSYRCISCDYLHDYILDYLGKDKLTVMGISWGSFYGIDFAYNHPEKVECYIGLNQTVGYYNDSVAYSMSVWIRMAQCLNSLQNYFPVFKES